MERLIIKPEAFGALQKYGLCSAALAHEDVSVGQQFEAADLEGRSQVVKVVATQKPESGRDSHIQTLVLASPGIGIVQPEGH